MPISLIPQHIREELEMKLVDWPFLRLIVLDFWFQLGLSAFLITTISIALYLPKIWRVTPDGFEPIVRISGLDMTQNWALKRSARKQEAAGEFAKASDSWQGAIAQNPADKSASRSFLQNYLNLRRPDRRAEAVAFSQMQWLFRLSQTNLADLELSARVCDRFGWYDLAAYLISPQQQQELPPRLEAVFIKALFQQNRMTEFNERLQKSAARLNDPEIRFYRLAYDAGWTDGARASEAFSELQAAAEQGENKDRLNRLLLRVAAQKTKLDVYARVLEHLTSRNEATAADHAMYWSLLATNGRKDEAVKLAESFTSAPASGLEAVRVAQTYLSLGLPERCRELLKQSSSELRRSPEVWIAYASVLENQQDWDEMRAIALNIRQDPGVRDYLWGYSYFLEGRAELAHQRDATAQVAFDKAAESSFDYPSIGLITAKGLTQLRQTDQALRIYKTIESKLEKNIEYWAGLFNTALSAQDSATILRAAEQGYQLNPKDVAIQNRYAAALLLNRIRADEAIKLTLPLYTKYPQSPATIINHSCALLLNNRTAEARSLLESVNVSSLKPVEASAYYLALFEAYHALKLWDRAWKACDKIPTATLFPIQREWLQEKQKEMPERLSGRSA